MIDKIFNIFSPSGSETLMRDFIAEQLKDYFDEIKTDDIGNLICKSANGGVCIECGMDSCGIMIVSTEKDKARFAGVGGINAEYLIDKKIIFKNDVFGIARYDGKTPAEAKISDLYIECEEGSLRTGSFGVVSTEYCEDKLRMFANGLGNRVGLAAVLTAAKKSAKHQNLTILFSAQKRLGSRGIQAFFAANEFDTVITVDGVECKNGIKSNEGCCLTVVDKVGVCRKSLSEKIKEVAIENGIRLKTSVSDQDLCMGHITTAGKGAACAAVVIPVEHKNSSFESVNKEDFDETVKLIEILMKGF